MCTIFGRWKIATVKEPLLILQSLNKRDDRNRACLQKERTPGIYENLSPCETKEIPGAAILAAEGDEIIHSIPDIM